MKSKPKTPVLIEVTPQFREHVDVVGEYLEDELHQKVSPYAGKFSISYVSQVAVGILGEAIRNDTLDISVIPILDAYYHAYRGDDEAVNTNVYFDEKDMAHLKRIVNFLDEKTNVQHVYHGKRINKKLIVVISLHYAYLITQQAK